MKRDVTSTCLTENGLTPVGEIFLARCKEARDLAVSFADQLKLREIYVFGSVARGRPQTQSDVDLMFVIDGDLADVERVRDFIMCDLSENYETIYPRVDAHACRYAKFHSDCDDGTVFGDFITVIQQEGIRIWHRAE